ncbi:MAG: isopeptide-forming domain-containing fimbrial protein [Coriobacteriaceae bacterium]|nr:isopeptide-forming domain-containing fimbrial protein [Coriobacteriaceae bacterium]
MRISRTRHLSWRYVRIAGAVLAALAAMAATAPAFAAEAGAAGETKTALPTIQKSVSADGVDYGKEAAGPAGHRFQYRIVLTMPEDVQGLKSLLYTVKDKPDAAIGPIADSVHAVILDASGKAKCTLDPVAKKTGGRFYIALGDLKRACPGLSFGDTVQIDYIAALSAKAKPGRYPNTAKLVFDRGNGKEETVEVTAKVKVPITPAKGTPAASRLPKTSDALPWAALIAAIVSGLALAGAQRRRNREEASRE